MGSLTEQMGSKKESTVKMYRDIRKYVCQGGGVFLGAVRKANKETAWQCEDVLRAGRFYELLGGLTAPDKDSNATGISIDPDVKYIQHLEHSNINLFLKVRELERKVQEIEPYLPIIKKFLSDYEASDERIEAKKRNLIAKYGFKKDKGFELWGGITQDIDKANKPLDDILNVDDE